jgi:hypothetical protein
LKTSNLVKIAGIGSSHPSKPKPGFLGAPVIADIARHRKTKKHVYANRDMVTQPYANLG